MAINWFSTWSDQNPQLVRELKGRVKPRNLVLTAIGSLGRKALVLLSDWQRLPVIGAKLGDRYCLDLRKIEMDALVPYIQLADAASQSAVEAGRRVGHKSPVNALLMVLTVVWVS